MRISWLVALVLMMVVRCAEAQDAGAPNVNGAPCNFDPDCMSGFCAAGVCCDSRCNNPCQSCSQVMPGPGKCVDLSDGADCGVPSQCSRAVCKGSPGLCTPVPAADGDSCTWNTPPACKNSSTCKAGSCERAAACQEGDLVLLEMGFASTRLPDSEAAALACAPSGSAFAPGVYLTNPDGGTVLRLDFNDRLLPFTSGMSNPVGLAFGPGLAGNFGDKLYVATDSGIERVNPAGVIFERPFNRPLNGNRLAKDEFGLAFGDAMGFSTDLYVVQDNGGIATIAPDGSVLSDVLSIRGFFAAIGFPPETARSRIPPWVPGLYGTAMPSLGIGRVDALGNGTIFAKEGGDGLAWSLGTGWNGDLFVTDSRVPSQLGSRVLRVRPDGTQTVFATLSNNGALGLTFCNGAMYVSSLADLFRVNPIMSMDMGVDQSIVPPDATAPPDATVVPDATSNPGVFGIAGGGACACRLTHRDQLPLGRLFFILVALALLRRRGK